MSTPKLMPSPYSQAGVSLIELIISIVIIGVAVAGVLSVMNLTTSRSADPMVRKQAIAIAESLLEEIELQPFTFCDPDDANATTATGTAGCATTAEVAPLGPDTIGTIETRYVVPLFDNVNDYHNFNMPSPPGIRDITNSSISSRLDAYSASVNITEVGAAFAVANDAALRIDVTVQSGAESVTLTGYRFRYAPTAVP